MLTLKQRLPEGFSGIEPQPAFTSATTFVK
jgi:hypothetical protein